MKISEAHTHHDVCIGLNKVVKCFHHLISAFGPFEVCVTFFIWLLHRKRTDYRIMMQTLQLLDYENRHLLLRKTKDCQHVFPIHQNESMTWHNLLWWALLSLPWILRFGNPELLWSSASPSTACTWFSALPAGLVPGLSGPPGPRPPSSHTCRYEAGAALWPTAALPRGMCCEGQCLDVFIVL